MAKEGEKTKEFQQKRSYHDKAKGKEGQSLGGQSRCTTVLKSQLLRRRREVIQSITVISRASAHPGFWVFDQSLILYLTNSTEDYLAQPNLQPKISRKTLDVPLQSSTI